MLVEENLQKKLMAGALSFQLGAFPHQHDDAIWTGPSCAKKQKKKTSKVYVVQRCILSRMVEYWTRKQNILDKIRKQLRFRFGVLLF